MLRSDNEKETCRNIMVSCDMEYMIHVYIIEKSARLHNYVGSLPLPQLYSVHTHVHVQVCKHTMVICPPHAGKQ